jgi:bifunctional DNase/RNase
VKVHGLIADPASAQPVVLLVDPFERLDMPIWIGPNEAAAIQA